MLISDAFDSISYKRAPALQLINVLVGITQNKLILKYWEMKRTTHKPD